MIKLVLESVSVKQDIDMNTQLLLLSFEDYGEAYIFANHEEINNFLGKEVIVSFRQEIIEGQLSKVVVTWSKSVVVTTLEKENNIKLYSEDDVEIGSSILFEDILEGTVYNNVILFCDSITQGASAKSDWVTLRVLDKHRRITSLKIFKIEKDTDVDYFKKKYIVCQGVIKNKYGLRAESADVTDQMTIHEDPEIVLAKQYILNNIKKDVEMEDVINRTGLLDKMADYVDDDTIQSTGAILLQTAIELSQAEELANATNKLDIQFLKRIIIASKFYVLWADSEEYMSNSLKSIIKLAGFTSIASKRLLSAIEETPSKKHVEREIADNLNNLSNSLVTSKYQTGLVFKEDWRWIK